MRSFKRDSRSVGTTACIAICATFFWFAPQITPANVQDVLLYVLVGWILFFTQSYPIAFNSSYPATKNVLNFICTSALAAGFSLFFYLGYGSGIDVYEWDAGSLLAASAAVPFAVGVFVYFFFLIAMRFESAMKHRLLFSVLALSALAITTTALLAQPTAGSVILFYCGSIVVFVGTFLSALSCRRIASEMLLRRLSFDTSLLVAILFAFFVFTHTIAIEATGSILGAIVLQVLIFFCLAALTLLIGLVLSRLRRAGSQGSAKGNQDEDFNFSWFVIRAFSGPITNYFIVSSPASLFAYFSIGRTLNSSFGGAYALSDESEAVARSAAVGASVCTLAMCFGPFWIQTLLGASLLGSILVAVTMGAGAWAACREFRRISEYYDRA